MNPGDLTTLQNAKGWLGLSGVPIAAITQANPAVIALVNAPPTPLSSGLSVGLSAINGMTQLNNTEQVITVIDPTHFSIPADSTSFGAYTSGGLVALSDTLMQRLISACSAYVQRWTDRTFRNLPYVETRDGTGGYVLPLINYPITSVTSVTIDGVAVPVAPALGTQQVVTVGFFGGPGGYLFDMNRLIVRGFKFWRGLQNVQVSYAGGYLVSNEPQTIPAGSPYSLMTLAHWNAGDRGVTYANGTALTSQPFGTVLAAGQYSTDSYGTYYFAAADAGKAVLISYGFVPFDVEQGTVDLIGDWLKYRDRIGTKTIAIEQQTITFTDTAMPSRALGALQQYRRVNFYSP